MRNPLPATLRHEDVLIAVDSREQLPLDLRPMQTVTCTLATGDYGLRDLPNVAAIERKSLSDLLGCIGQHRERFERELQRLLAYPVRAVVVESTWDALEAGNWRSQITPAAAVSSCLGWIAAGIPIVMAGNHARAGQYVARILFLTARRRWHENRALVQAALTQKELNLC